jgi:endonuclease I
MTVLGEAAAFGDAADSSAARAFRWSRKIRIRSTAATTYSVMETDIHHLLNSCWICARMSPNTSTRAEPIA